MIAPPAPIVTERLVIRPWTDDDVDALSEAVTASIEHLRPWMKWAAHEPLTREERLGVIARFREGWEAGDDFTMGIFIDGTAIGGTGLHPRIGAGGVEIGYWIHVDHSGRGYATEVAGALARVALALDGIERVEIHHDIANVASGRIPAKLGFTRTEERRRDIAAPGESGVEWVWTLRLSAPRTT